MVRASDVAETILSGGSALTRLVAGRKEEQLLLPQDREQQQLSTGGWLNVGATAEPTS